MTDLDLAAGAPALILAAGAVVASVLPIRAGVRALAWLGAAASIGAAATAIAIGPGAAGFNGTVARDGPSLFFVPLVGVVAAALLGLVAAEPRRGGRGPVEVALVLFSACGAALVISAADLVVLFVGLALLTVPAYVLTGRQRAPRDGDGAVRHFLLGAASSATASYGVALLYAATGETAYAGVGRATHNPLYLAGLALVLAGLAFHTVIASAHRWSILVNVAAVGALLRLVAATRSGEVALDLEVSFATLAALALAIAGLAALTERRLRRLIGYATVSQLGYVAVAVAGSAAPAAAFALAAYAALAIGLFALLAVVPGDEPALDDLAGLARHRPLLVLALGVLVMGLVGIPPAAGFLAKVYVLEAGLRAQLLWLVVLGALATVTSAVACVRLVLACFAPQPLDAIAPPRARVATVVVLLAALAIVAVGLVPGPLLEAAQTVRF